MRALGVTLVAAAMIVLGSSAWPGPRGVVRSFDFSNGSGTIDYDGGFIEATAIGTVDMSKMVNSPQAESVALRTARHLAYEVLAETVGKIQIDSKTLYQNAMASIDALKTETHAVIRGAMPVGPGTVEWVRDRKTKEEVPLAKVTLRLYLTGEEGLNHLIDKHVPPPVVQIAVYNPPLVPAAPSRTQAPPAPPTPSRPQAEAPSPQPAAPAAPQEQPQPPAAKTAPSPPSPPAAQAAPEKQPLPAQPVRAETASQPAQPAAPAPEAAKRFGALVVDTRGVAPGYQPAARVFVRDEAGGVVYGPGVAPVSLARDGKLPVRYASTVDEAKGFFPGAGEPLVVKAASVPGPGEVVIRAADAQAVVQANLAEAFLREARVAVVVQ